MLDLRLPGSPRLLSGALAFVRPANSNRPLTSEPLAAVLLSQIEASGINWTRHRRPYRPRRPTPRDHLRLVK